jgi:hypothetical protein
MSCQGKSWKNKVRECMERQGIPTKVMVMHDNAWKSMERKDKTWHVKARHGMSRKGMARKGKGIHGKESNFKARHSKER